ELRFAFTTQRHGGLSLGALGDAASCLMGDRVGHAEATLHAERPSFAVSGLADELAGGWGRGRLERREGFAKRGILGAVVGVLVPSDLALRREGKPGLAL